MSELRRRYDQRFVAYNEPAISLEPGRKLPVKRIIPDGIEAVTYPPGASSDSIDDGRHGPRSHGAQQGWPHGHERGTRSRATQRLIALLDATPRAMTARELAIALELPPDALGSFGMSRLSARLHALWRYGAIHRNDAARPFRFWSVRHGPAEPANVRQPQEGRRHG